MPLFLSRAAWRASRRTHYAYANATPGYASRLHRLLVVAEVVVFRGVGQALFGLAVLRAECEDRLDPVDVELGPFEEPAHGCEQHAVGPLGELGRHGVDVLAQDGDRLVLVGAPIEPVDPRG